MAKMNIMAQNSAKTYEVETLKLEDSIFHVVYDFDRLLAKHMKTCKPRINACSNRSRKEMNIILRYGKATFEILFLKFVEYFRDLLCLFFSMHAIIYGLYCWRFRFQSNYLVHHVWGRGNCSVGLSIQNKISKNLICY